MEQAAENLAQQMLPWVMEQIANGLTFEQAIEASFTAKHEYLQSLVGNREFANQAFVSFMQ